METKKAAAPANDEDSKSAGPAPASATSSEVRRERAATMAAGPGGFNPFAGAGGSTLLAQLAAKKKAGGSKWNLRTE